MKREEMIGFIVRSLDNMMMRNAVGDEKVREEGDDAGDARMDHRLFI